MYLDFVLELKMTKNPGSTDAHVLDELRRGLVDPPKDSAPMMRWWWFGPHVSRTRIREQLDTMNEAGFGGVELAFVYPLQSESDTFMSDSFLQDVRYAAEEAKSLSLRFDLTLGSGWSYGGGHISNEHAARRIHWDKHEIGADERTVNLNPSWPGDELLGAYIGDGSIQEMPDEYAHLEGSSDSIHVPSGKGPRVVLVAWSRLTGQNVKRASVGAEGPVLDHYSSSATDAHIAAVCAPMLNAVSPELVYSVFCDSLEVYGANWSHVFPEEFLRRRGYEVIPELWKIAVSSDNGKTFRAEFHETLSELYEQNFVSRLRDWAERRSVLFRIQSYGEPPASVSSYRSADLPEGEGWGWREITQSRWATSAAQLYHMPVVSSEIWTWVHSPSFRATPLDLKGELHEHALIGVNHFIGHGWPYYEEQDQGIGWLFYAAGSLDDRNPWWPAIRNFTAYTRRLAWLMRQGRRISQVGIYAPYTDVYSRMGNGTPHDINLWAATKKHIGDQIPHTIRCAGYDFDLFDDDALAVMEPDRFPVVLLPRTEMIPEATREWLHKASAAGTTVIEIDPSAATLREAGDLEKSLNAAIPPSLEVAMTSGLREDVGVTQRRVSTEDVYFVANTGSSQAKLDVRLSSPRFCIEQWDLETGRVVNKYDGRGSVSLTLEAYEAVILVGTDSSAPTKSPGGEGYEARLDLTGPWTARFGSEETESEVSIPHRWEDDPKRLGYSGAATYRCVVTWEHAHSSAVLDFGAPEAEVLSGADQEGFRGKSFRAGVLPPVGVVAEVYVNGELAGVAWHAPYRIPVSSLQRGENCIEITVYNTRANQLSKDAGVLDSAESSTHNFGRRFRMQDLHHATRTVNSGLLAVPSLKTSTRVEAQRPESSA